MRIVMIGAGYVGLVSAACFADFGHDVTCVDKDSNKIAALNQYRIPIFEPDLDKLVESGINSGRLKFGVDLSDMGVKGLITAEDVERLVQARSMAEAGGLPDPIAADPGKAYTLTIKRNTVAVITDGSAVLGLGDLGPEAALPVGRFRLRGAGSAGGHNGLKSIEGALQRQDYARLRIGVGPKPPELDGLADYVLADFLPEEREVIEGLLATMADAVECWVAEGIEIAMTRFNR